LPAVHLAATNGLVDERALVLEGDALDHVGAEEGELKDVAFELLGRPRIPTVRGGAVAELVPAQGEGGRLGVVVAEVYRCAVLHTEVAEQMADAEQRAEFVGGGDGKRAVRRRGDTEGFGGEFAIANEARLCVGEGSAARG